MENLEDLGLKAFTITAAQVPAIILKMLRVNRPLFLPPVGEDILETKEPIDQIVLVVIDNFGLFEIITYQPTFLIKSLENLLLIETESELSSLSEPMLQEIFFSRRNRDFNLISFLKQNNKQAKVFARNEDIPKITNDPTIASAENSDIDIYVKGLKVVNRSDLLVLHFSDFDEMYDRYSMEPPEEIASKIMRRTDQWLDLFYKQSIQGTALVVIGNHGRKPIEMNFEGKAAEWKRANLPIGLIRVSD